MTDRTDLTTADLASQEPTAQDAPERTADPDADRVEAERADDARDDVLADERPRADALADPATDVGRRDSVGDATTGSDADFQRDGDFDRTSASTAADTSVTNTVDPTTVTGPLLASDDAEGFRARWTDVQTAFVDSPRQSVEQADALVAEVMQLLARTFADERARLERQWDHGDDVATDELRTAFQRYRSFFERLLST